MDKDGSGIVKRDNADLLGGLGIFYGHSGGIQHNPKKKRKK